MRTADIFKNTFLLFLHRQSTYKLIETETRPFSNHSPAILNLAAADWLTFVTREIDSLPVGVALFHPKFYRRTATATIER